MKPVVSIKMTPKQAGKLYVQACEMEDKLSAAKKAMEGAKNSKGWDSIPYELHKNLDELFKAISN